MGSNNFNPSHFFGSPEDVKNIQHNYLKYFPAGGTVLDLGCGEGVFIELLNASGRKGIGVDSSERCVKICKSKNLEVAQAGIIERLNDGGKKFDGIFASHVIEHFSASQGLEIVNLASDLLLPGGILIIITPSFNDILVSGERFWLDITHVRPYPLKLLEAFYTSAGLRVVQSGYDRKTRARPRIHHPVGLVGWGISKLRYGRNYDTGDTFIVGQKN